MRPSKSLAKPIRHLPGSRRRGRSRDTTSMYRSTELPQTFTVPWSIPTAIRFTATSAIPFASAPPPSTSTVTPDRDLILPKKFALSQRPWRLPFRLRRRHPRQPTHHCRLQRHHQFRRQHPRPLKHRYRLQRRHRFRRQHPRPLKHRYRLQRRHQFRRQHPRPLKHRYRLQRRHRLRRQHPRPLKHRYRLQRRHRLRRQYRLLRQAQRP
jgi:hypothetical protein